MTLSFELTPELKVETDAETNHGNDSSNNNSSGRFKITTIKHETDDETLNQLIDNIIYKFESNEDVTQELNEYNNYSHSIPFTQPSIVAQHLSDVETYKGHIIINYVKTNYLNLPPELAYTYMKYKSSLLSFEPHTFYKIDPDDETSYIVSLIEHKNE